MKQWQLNNVRLALAATSERVQITDRTSGFLENGTYHMGRAQYGALYELGYFDEYGDLTPAARARGLQLARRYQERGRLATQPDDRVGQEVANEEAGAK